MCACEETKVSFVTAKSVRSETEVLVVLWSCAAYLKKKSVLLTKPIIFLVVNDEIL